MNNIKETFEPLHSYKSGSNVKFSLVTESMNNHLNEEDDGFLGNIINKGVSFIPRAMRFNKARKIMKTSLNGYISKAKTTINNFSKSSQTKIEKIINEYYKIKNEKIDPLIAEEDNEQAAVMIEKFIKELEEYKSAQIQQLDKSIENILGAYTSSIDKRIDTPGFVLNVNLSEKGKGELKAKWQELSSTANMKVDEYKTDMILKNSSYKKLDSTIADAQKLLSNTKGLDNISLTIDDIKKVGSGYSVLVRPSFAHKRLPVKSKGIIITKDPSEPGSSGVKHTYAKVKQSTTSSPYQMPPVEISSSDYIIPWMEFMNVKKPFYGDVAQLKDMSISGDNADSIQSNRNVRSSQLKGNFSNSNSSQQNTKKDLENDIENDFLDSIDDEQRLIQNK